MPTTFDPLLGKIRKKDVFSVPEYNNADKPGAAVGDVWVKTTSINDGNVGEPRGLLLALTYSGNGTKTYAFSYKAQDGSVVRTSIT